MAISYVRAKRMISVGANPGQKYLACIFRGVDIGLEKISQEIAESSSLSEGDIMNCLKQFEKRVASHILNGSAVKFELLGMFVPSIKATACDSLEEVTSQSILKTRVLFRPNARFTKELKTKSNYVLKSLEVKGYQPK